MELEQDEIVIDLREVINAVAKRWWIVALSFVTFVTTAVTFLFFIMDPIYTAQTTLFVGRQQSKEETTIQYNDVMLNQQLVKDYRELAKSRVIAKEVIDNLGLQLEVDEFIKKIEVELLKDTRLFKISVNDTNPEDAAIITNELSKVFIEKATEIMKVENVQVIDIAEVPKEPSKPSKKLYTVLAAALGIIVGLGMIYLIEMLDNTIKTPSDVEKYLGFNVIGAIPMFDEKEVN